MLLVVSAAVHADEDALQRAFVLGMQAQEAGDLARAEPIFREMLTSTHSPRVKLELARTLFAQAKYAEAKSLFKEVSVQPETPWRVRDNIALFVREIEERTGYLKFGVTVVSDSNPGNLARQKEFSIGDLQVTPAEAPKRLTGLRYSLQGWQPLEPIGGAGYLTASYVDYPTEEFDRLTVDAGLRQEPDGVGPHAREGGPRVRHRRRSQPVPVPLPGTRRRARPIRNRPARRRAQVRQGALFRLRLSRCDVSQRQRCRCAVN